MAIELKGYNPAFENVVYAREMIFVGEHMPPTTLKEIVLLAKFTEPTEEDVVESLVNAARNGSSLILSEKTLREAKSPLEIAVAKLPDKVKKDLATRAPDCLNFVRQNTPAMPAGPEDLPSSRQFLSAEYGWLPPELIERYMGDIIKEGAEWYRNALSNEGLRENGLGKKTHVVLKYDGKLPERNDIDILLKHETRDSRILRVSSYRQNVPEIVEALYAGIRSPKDYALLQNVSDKLLEDVVTPPIIAFLRLSKETAQANSGESSRGSSQSFVQ